MIASTPAFLSIEVVRPGRAPSEKTTLEEEIRISLDHSFWKRRRSVSNTVVGTMSISVRLATESERTHIGVVRYPEGTDAVGMLMTLLFGGRAGWTRIFTWLWMLLKHPLRALHVHNPAGFACQTMLLLVMQTVDASRNTRLKRRWYWPFAKQLNSEGFERCRGQSSDLQCATARWPGAGSNLSR